MSNVLHLTGSDHEHEGDLRVNSINVEDGTVNVSGDVVVRDYVMLDDGTLVIDGTLSTPLLFTSNGGAVDGEVDAILVFDEDLYEEEDFERVVGAIEAGLASTTLDQLWDDLEEDQEEDVDYLREDGGVEDALNLLMSLGITSMIFDYLVEHGDSEALGAHLRADG